MIGIVGSRLHVLTNDKIRNKKQCIKDINKQSIKDEFKYTGTAAGIGITMAAIASKSKKFSDHVQLTQKVIEKGIRNFKFKDRSIMAKIKKSNIYKSFNKSPIPVKAGIIATTGALLTLFPITRAIKLSHKANIEKDYENKPIRIYTEYLI